MRASYNCVPRERRGASAHEHHHQASDDQRNGRERKERFLEGTGKHSLGVDHNGSNDLHPVGYGYESKEMG